MNISKVPFGSLSALSFKDVYYQTQPESLDDFISFTPDLNGLSKAIESRKLYPVDRSLLVDVLADHYDQHSCSEMQFKNISQLRNDHTFTIITAHQPCLMGGPAYYFYKICSTINLANKLNNLHKEHHFVPVFISGSEDHDFEEVQSLQLFGKSITWETQQSGPVGRFSTEGLDQIVATAKEILGNNETAQHLGELFEAALAASISYNDFVFHWLNEVFKSYGLIVVNMDDARLKKAFTPILKKELLERISEPLVSATQEKLSEFNFKPQAFARDINIFYIDGPSRERILYGDGKYHINNRGLTFTEQEMLEILDNHPERFSPNVVLRPMYEEFILPNLAYIGGGGELAYWLERKTQFEAFGVFFPVLIRRNSVMMISKAIQNLMTKLQLNEDEILLDEDVLITRYLEKSTDNDFHLTSETEEVQRLFTMISEKAAQIDATLENYVLSEGQKVIKAVENIESRLKRTLKQREETSINQIRNLKQKLFPNNGLQERQESYLQYMVTEGSGLTDILVDQLNPLEKEFLFFYL